MSNAFIRLKILRGSLPALAASLVLSAGSTAQTPEPAASRPAGKTFRIAGTVVNSVTGAPLAEARVALAHAGRGTTIAQTMTSSDGRFEFSNVPAGKFSLQGAKRGYLPGAYNQHEQYSTAIVTGAGIPTGELVLRLTPMAAIYGYVVDEAGEPVRRANVQLYTENHDSGYRRVVRETGSNTDDRGYYDFSHLRPGNYFISVTAHPWYAVHPISFSMETEKYVQQASSALDVAYPITYFGGATESTEAAPITLGGGDRLQADVHLAAVPAVHLVVRATQGQEPRVPPQPMLQKPVFDTFQTLFAGPMRMVAPGMFESDGIAPGEYTLRFSGDEAAHGEQAANVRLSQGKEDMSNLRREPLASLTVSARSASEETLPKQFGFALVDGRHRTVAIRQVDSSGTARFEQVAPGDYAIVFNWAVERWAVVGILTPKGATAGHGVTVSAGETLEVTAALSPGVVTVEGAVQQAGVPLAGCMVVLIPEKPETHREFLRRDQSDMDGTFGLRGVLPGNYTIVAVTDAWGTDWLQPEVLARYAEHGQKLTIGKLQKGSVLLPDPVEVIPK